MVKRTKIVLEKPDWFKVLAFGLISLLFYTAYFGYKESNWWQAFSFSCFLLPVTLGTSYYVNTILIPRFYFAKRYKRFALNTVYVVVLSIWFIVASFTLAFFVVGDLRLVNLTARSRDLLFVIVAVFMAVIINAVVSLLRHSGAVTARNQELKNKVLESELKLKVQELNYLKNQINPHFLFNSLNTLYGLALTKAIETPDAIVRLSNFLDYVLYKAETGLVSFEEELNHIRDYIELEKMRFGEDVDVHLKLEGELSKVTVPPMLFIPFVENAFKHGHIVNDKLSVSIRFSVADNILTFEINNTSMISVEEENDSKGIGIKNTRKRLDLLYRSNYDLSIADEMNSFKVKLKIDTDKLIAQPTTINEEN